GGPDNVTVVVLEVEGTPPPRGGAEVPRGEPAPSPARDRAARRGGRRIPVRLAIWVLALLVLGLGGLLGVRSWVNRSYFVGVAEGKVAIFRGVPAAIGGLHLNHVQEATDIPVASVPEFYRRNLDE